MCYLLLCLYHTLHTVHSLCTPKKSQVLRLVDVGGGIVYCLFVNEVAVAVFFVFLHHMDVCLGFAVVNAFNDNTQCTIILEAHNNHTN